MRLVSEPLITTPAQYVMREYYASHRLFVGGFRAIFGGEQVNKGGMSEPAGNRTGSQITFRENSTGCQAGRTTPNGEQDTIVEGLARPPYA